MLGRVTLCPSRGSHGVARWPANLDFCCGVYLWIADINEIWAQGGHISHIHRYLTNPRAVFWELDDWSHGRCCVAAFLRCPCTPNQLGSHFTPHKIWLFTLNHLNDQQTVVTERCELFMLNSKSPFLLLWGELSLLPKHSQTWGAAVFLQEKIGSTEG